MDMPHEMHKPDILAIQREMEDKPMVTLTSQQLEEIKNWKTHNTYNVTLQIKQLTSDAIENGHVKSKFEILSVKSNN